MSINTKQINMRLSTRAVKMLEIDVLMIEVLLMIEG